MPPASSPRSPASFPAHRLFSAALRSVFSNLAVRRPEPGLPDRRRPWRSPTQASWLSVHYWIPFQALPIDGLLLNRKNVSSLLLCATVVRCDIRVVERHLGVEARHDRFDQTDAVKPADAACCDVCIPAAVKLFPRE